MNLEHKDALALAQALQRSGTKLEGLKAVNPWSIEQTPRSRNICMILEELEPGLANKLKADAGHESMTPSLAYVASMAAGVKPQEMEGEAASDYARFNPEAVAEANQAEEQRLMEYMDNYVEKSQRAREGDKNYERRLADEKAQQEAMAQRNAEAAALNQRMAAKRQQQLNEARIKQGAVIIPN